MRTFRAVQAFPDEFRPFIESAIRARHGKCLYSLFRLERNSNSSPGALTGSRNGGILRIFRFRRGPFL